MSRAIVISQPFYLPWAGLFDQMRLSDLFVHFEDVQLPTGSSFINRVQVKGAPDPIWLTVPIERSGRKDQLIKDVKISSGPWRKKHRETLRHCYHSAQCYEDMIGLVDVVLSGESEWLVELLISGLDTISNYLQIDTMTKRSSDLNATGRSTERLINLCRGEEADVYISGHGGLNYIDDAAFVENDLEIRYMQYSIDPYDQFGSDFSPYFSILDLIAHRGKQSLSHLQSTCVRRDDWRQT